MTIVVDSLSAWISDNDLGRAVHAFAFWQSGTNHRARYVMRARSVGHRFE
jgi:hypothetical protein